MSSLENHQDAACFKFHNMMIKKLYKQMSISDWKKTPTVKDELIITA